MRNETDASNGGPVSDRLAGLVPVHVGQPEPGSEEDQWLRTKATQPDRWGRRTRTPQVPAGLDWQGHGLEPRWLETETSDCAVAIEPGFFSGHGDAERDRFLTGAARRGEVALLVSVIGDAADNQRGRSPLSRVDADVHLGDLYTSIEGRRLPPGTQRQLAPDLGAADRDLALRLRNRPSTDPWWALELTGVTTIRGDGFGGESHHPAQGRLQPLLVNDLGEPVAAVRYALPHVPGTTRIIPAVSSIG